MHYHIYAYDDGAVLLGDPVRITQVGRHIHRISNASRLLVKVCSHYLSCGSLYPGGMMSTQLYGHAHCQWCQHLQGLPPYEKSHTRLGRDTVATDAQNAVAGCYYSCFSLIRALVTPTPLFPCPALYRRVPSHFHLVHMIAAQWQMALPMLAYHYTLWSSHTWTRRGTCC